MTSSVPQGDQLSTSKWPAQYLKVAGLVPQSAQPKDLKVTRLVYVFGPQSDRTSRIMGYGNVQGLVLRVFGLMSFEEINGDTTLKDQYFLDHG